MVDRVEYSVSLREVGGQTDFPGVREAQHRAMQECDAFIVVYATTSGSSFREAVDELLDEARRVRAEAGIERERAGVRFVLVGSKVDLHLQRQVSREVAAQKAVDKGAAFFCETCANSDAATPNNRKILEECVRVAVRR
eukprot:TRINITY_DN769_c0_g1_i3.p2 TRINITY_DN769_c0_g1~~TRINITY_DN769_c0_g1_i3.p2  ORF type:complete len:139 (-),score=27.57 TRINITY_DN769_c0_g1_i3:96-512(-)